MSNLLFNEGSAAATPAATKVVVYAKSDGLLYSKDDAGTEILISMAAATQAQMEAASSTVVAVTPGRMINHPGIVKVAAQFGVAGNIRGTSYNVSSITDSGTGTAVVNFSITMSGVEYPAVVTGYVGSSTNFFTNINSSVGQTATSTAVICVNGASSVNTDPSVGYNFMATGDI